LQPIHVFIPSQFDLGLIDITPAALEVIGDEHALNIISLHAQCHWGDISDESRRANNAGITNGARLLSVYWVAGEKIWVITDGHTDACGACLVGAGQCEPERGEWVGERHFRTDLPPRRHLTTVLLPREY
jgi:hypothetical protein